LRGRALELFGWREFSRPHAFGCLQLVGRLEDLLGVRLLHRTTRRVALTSEGDVYFARARQILADIEEAEVEVAKSRGSPRDDCASIPVVPSGAACTVSVRIPRQLSHNIDLQLSITDRVVDLVTEHADITIRAGPVVDVSLSARKIAEFERTICAAPSCLAQNGVPRTPAELANHLCSVMTIPASSRRPFVTNGGIGYAEIAPRAVTDSGETALRLALRGAGIVRLSDIILLAIRSAAGC
jgi:DNA-binding transcriptional LysR family regulator